MDITGIKVYLEAYVQCKISGESCTVCKIGHDYFIIPSNEYAKYVGVVDSMYTFKPKDDTNDYH